MNRRIASVAVLSALVLVMSFVPAGAQTPAPTGVGSGIPLIPASGYNNATSPDAPVLLRQTRFEPGLPGASPAQGSVQHRRIAGREVLHFTPDFAAPAGDRWEVVAGASGDLDQAARLGALRAVTGTQEYDVPVDLDFTVVAVYDRQRREAALLAGLPPEPECASVPSRGSLALKRPQDAPDACLSVNTTAELNRTGTPPESVDLAAYRLQVGGAVERPLQLSFDDIRAMAPQSEVSPLICSGVFADVVEWTGVPLSAVLQAAGVRPDYRAVRLDGMDRYFTVLQREDTDPADVVLAYWSNGDPLPLEHGYPLRAVVKRDYGSKWIKWVNKITVLEK